MCSGRRSIRSGCPGGVSVRGEFFFRGFRYSTTKARRSLRTCSLLSLLHHAVKVHRDLNSHNILVAADGKGISRSSSFQLKITDFSKACSVQGGPVETTDQAVPADLSPEVHLGIPHATVSDKRRARVSGPPRLTRHFSLARRGRPPSGDPFEAPLSRSSGIVLAQKPSVFWLPMMRRAVLWGGCCTDCCPAPGHRTIVRKKVPFFLFGRAMS